MPSSTPTFNVPRSNDPKLDGILEGSQWGVLNLTYTMPNNPNFYVFGTYGQFTSGYVNTQGFQFVNNVQIQAIRDSFSQIQSFTQASFTLVDPNFQRGDLRFAEATFFHDTDGEIWDVSTAFGMFPQSLNGGDVWFNPRDYNNPKPGTFAHATFMHEIGHALGLKHPHNKSGVFNLLPKQWDSVEFTVMSYQSYVGSGRAGYKLKDGNYPRTYMVLDILALQYLYGADFGFNGGDTVYRYNPNTNVVFETIWDGGGTDTYDFSNYRAAVKIDLRPGQGSILAADQLAVLNGQDVDNGAKPIKASASVYNAFLFNGDLRSLIENANGGSGDDHIVGNQIANTLDGNGGRDTAKGAGGDDIVIGRAGNDELFGEDGDDTLDGGAGGDLLNGGPGRDLAGYILAKTGVVVNLQNPSQNKGDAKGDVFKGIEDAIGSRFADTLTGDSQANFLGGDAGKDRLTGNAGRDSLDGGLGDDVLFGGGDGDRVTGGVGKDRFLYLALSDSRGAARDTITDFSHNQGDRIALDAIDAVAGPGNHKFSFIGSAGFSPNSEGELRFIRQGGDAVLLADVNGDGRADFSIVVLDVNSLVGGDFIL